MIVYLQETQETTSAVKDCLVLFVGEMNVFKLRAARDGQHGALTPGVSILFHLGEDFGGAVEAGEGFGELGSDVHNLENGGDHEGQEHVVAKVVSDGPGMGKN